MPRYSDADLLDEIRRVADVAGADGAPSLQDFRDHSDIADTTVLRRFDSWNAAVAKAGFEPNDPQERIPTEDLIDELQRLHDEVGRAPKIEEMKGEGEYWPSTYKKRFGSWSEALDAAFDHIDADDLYASRMSTNPEDPGTPGPHVSAEELIEDLRALADELDRVPTAADVVEEGNHAIATYHRRFGWWGEAVEAAFEETDEA